MLLLREQLKNEFGRGTWSRGVTYDRGGRIQDVRSSPEFNGNAQALSSAVIEAKVSGTDENPYSTKLNIESGIIKSSECSCPAHGVFDTHCKHVAALAHWAMRNSSPDPEQVFSDIHTPAHQKNRGPQRQNPAGQGPRDRVNQTQIGPSVQPGANRPAHPNQKQKNKQKKNLQKIQEPVKVTAVTFVKGLMEGEKQVGITLEPAFRYRREDGKERVYLRGNCRYDGRNTVWIAPDKRRLIPNSDRVPFLGHINANKMVYTGNMAVHMMSTLMTSSHAAQIIFDDSLKLDVVLDPLKINVLNLGKKQNGHFRELTFDLKNSTVAITADELRTMAGESRVAGNFAWLGNKLYTMQYSLDWIDAHTSADGEPSIIRGANPVNQADLFPVVVDDEARPLHPLMAFRMGLELGAKEFQVAEDWPEYHEWLKTFERAEIPSLPRVSYGFDLRDYQTNGLSWLWSLYHRGLSALLADDMGLGKTHQVLALLSSLYKSKNHKPEHPSLVVAPTSVVAAWEQKLARYKTGLRCHTFHGKERWLPTEGFDVILTTYGILQRDDLLLRKQWHAIILDEAQAIKNPATISAKQARSLNGKFRVVMTGTPVENSMTDLWSLMEFLLPGYFGSFDRFRKLYVPREGMPNQEQTSTVRRLITPFLLRRTKNQVLQELPEKIEEVRSCQLTEQQQAKYNEYLNSKEAEALRAGLRGGGKIDYVSILALLTRLKQVCDHPGLPAVTGGKCSVESLDLNHSGKWDVFEEILEEALGSGLKIVVFTQYLAVIDMLALELKKRGVGYGILRGETTDRGAVLTRFSEDPECKVFLCSLLAGGMGIDLTAASVCIHFDRWWNPAKENQATDRLHRIGQTRGVQVFKLQIPGTIEERISNIIESKNVLADALVEESAVGLKTFSRQELLALLTEVPMVATLKPEPADAKESVEGPLSSTGAQFITAQPSNVAPVLPLPLPTLPPVKPLAAKPTVSPAAPTIVADAESKKPPVSPASSPQPEEQGTPPEIAVAVAKVKKKAVRKVAKKTIVKKPAVTTIRKKKAVVPA